MDVDQLESLIEWIYTSALVPVLWNQTVDTITTFTRGRDSVAEADDESSLDLKPYLQSLQRHLQKAQIIHDTLCEHLDRRGIGQLSLDEHGRVTFCDATARACLERGGLSIDSETLRAGVAMQQELLDEAFSRALSEDATPVVMAFNRPKHSTPLFATFSRIDAGSVDDVFDSANGVMVQLRDPDDFSHIDASRLQASFGLTDRESALALAMVRGESLLLYTRDKGVSRETARAQLKSLFRKVGVHSQHQLVSVIMNALR